MCRPNRFGCLGNSGREMEGLETIPHSKPPIPRTIPVYRYGMGTEYGRCIMVTEML